MIRRSLFMLVYFFLLLLPIYWLLNMAASLLSSVQLVISLEWLPF